MKEQPSDKTRARSQAEGRPRWRRPGDWPILVKILLSMVAVVMLALGVATAVNAFTLYTDLREQISAEFESLATTQVNHLGDILSKQFTLLNSVALIHRVQDAAEAASAGYSGDAAVIEAELLDMDQQWLAAADNSPLVQSVVDPQTNALTRQLQDFQEAFPDHVEIFLTDRYGGLLAATGRTSDYYQADEAWWQAAYNGGQGAYYISQPEYDDSAGYTALDMAIPIVSASGQVAGIARTTFRIEAIYQAVAGLRLGETGHVAVIDRTGIVLADPNPEHIGETMPPSWVTPEIVDVASGRQELVNGEGVPVLAGYASLVTVETGHEGENQAIRSLGWVLFVNQFQSEAYAPVAGAIWRGVLAAGIFALIAASLALILSRAIVNPITGLVEVARSMTAGDLGLRAPSLRRDETGELAATLNSMADEIAGMVGTLEQRVAERTRDLEAAADVARATTSRLDLDELLEEVVDLVRERFDLYYVGLFLVDEEERFAVLRAGTGDAGKHLLAQEHRLEIGGDSMIGRCVASSQAAIALDVGDEAHRFDNPLLPDTRSEMALPLRSRGQVVGAMTVQDDMEAAFNDSDIAVMQTMADQVAVAIDNARLFAEAEAALEEMEATHRRYLGQAWTEYTASRQGYGYALTEAGIRVLDAATLPETQRAADKQVPATASAGEPGARTGSAPPAVIVPIKQMGQSIGVLGIQGPGNGRHWTPEEVALVESVAEQFSLAADNLRLLEETQRRAARERLLGEIASRMRQTLDVDAVLKAAVSEMRQALELHDIAIQLGGNTVAARSPEEGRS